MKNIKILIIEDDNADFDIITESLPSDINFEFYRAIDGEEAIKLVKDYEPHIIFLDLNIPKIDGKTVIKRLKNDDKYKHIPIIVVSTSMSPDDIATTYRSGANAYLTKGIDFLSFSNKMSDTGNFWLKSAILSE